MLEIYLKNGLQFIMYDGTIERVKDFQRRSRFDCDRSKDFSMRANGDLYRVGQNMPIANMNLDTLELYRYVEKDNVRYLDTNPLHRIARVDDDGRIFEGAMGSRFPGKYIGYCTNILQLKDFKKYGFVSCELNDYGVRGFSLGCDKTKLNKMYNEVAANHKQNTKDFPYLEVLEYLDSDEETRIHYNFYKSEKQNRSFLDWKLREKTRYNKLTPDEMRPYLNTIRSEYNFYTHHPEYIKRFCMQNTIQSYSLYNFAMECNNNQQNMIKNKKALIERNKFKQVVGVLGLIGLVAASIFTFFKMESNVARGIGLVVFGIMFVGFLGEGMGYEAPFEDIIPGVAIVTFFSAVVAALTGLFIGWHNALFLVIFSSVSSCTVACIFAFISWLDDAGKLEGEVYMQEKNDNFNDFN